MLYPYAFGPALVLGFCVVWFSSGEPKLNRMDRWFLIIACSATTVWSITAFPHPTIDPSTPWQVLVFDIIASIVIGAINLVVVYSGMMLGDCRPFKNRTLAILRGPLQ